MATTLSVLIDEFLLDGRARRLAPKTLSSYAANLRYFLEWLRCNGYPAHPLINWATWRDSRRADETVQSGADRAPRRSS